MAGATPSNYFVHPKDPGQVTVVDIIALDRLMPSFRLALHYVLTVAAQRHPALLCLHRFRDEAYLALAAILEAHSLARFGASFAESFYGLRRQLLNGNSSRGASRQCLSPVALLLLLLPAYLRSKADKHLGDAEHADAEAAAREGANDEGTTARQHESSGRTNHTDSRANLWHLLRQLCRTICASVDTLQLAQLVLFMYDRSRHATLSQRLLAYTLRRPARHSFAASEPTPKDPPISRLTHLPSPSHTAAIERLARLVDGPLRYARHALLLSLLGYRFLEWWHAPDQARLPPPQLIPPPPPPPLVIPAPVPAPVPAGAPAPFPVTTLVPAGLCGSCRMVPSEPMASPSGFVFCTPCALGYRVAIIHACTHTRARTDTRTHVRNTCACVHVCIHAYIQVCSRGSQAGRAVPYDWHAHGPLSASPHL